MLPIALNMFLKGGIKLAGHGPGCCLPRRQGQLFLSYNRFRHCKKGNEVSEGSQGNVGKDFANFL